VARLRGVAEQALRSEGDSRAKHEALADCLEESERIMAMLNTLMDISEAESGAMKLALEDVNLSSVIDEVVDLYRYMAEDRLISLSFQSPGGLYLRADRARLRQVLANLIDNALKYTPGGGHVHIDARQTNGYIIIAVEDTGVGISSEEMPRIWDRLYRGDKSRSERGLGLGLSLVKAVVQAHGGRVTAAPNSPVGSCFTVYLPLNSVDSAISLPHLSKM
jgi:signal transduction histidine kinase